jgi:hypothetical protein
VPLVEMLQKLARECCMKLVLQVVWQASEGGLPIFRTGGLPPALAANRCDGDTTSRQSRWGANRRCAT